MGVDVGSRGDERLEHARRPHQHGGGVDAEGRRELVQRGEHRGVRVPAKAALPFPRQVSVPEHHPMRHLQDCQYSSALK